MLCKSTGALLHQPRMIKQPHFQKFRSLFSEDGNHHEKELYHSFAPTKNDNATSFPKISHSSLKMATIMRKNKIIFISDCEVSYAVQWPSVHSSEKSSLVGVTWSSTVAFPPTSVYHFSLTRTSQCATQHVECVTRLFFMIYMIHK